MSDEEPKEPRMAEEDATQTPVTQTSSPSIGVVAMDLLHAGSVAGDFVLGELIARGGYGDVYVAEHRVSGLRVAVKVLRAELSYSDAIVERFIREARAVERIDHPNLVKIHELDRLPDGRPYYAMEYLEAGSLRDRVRSKGAFTSAETLGFLAPICDALEAVHQAGYVHRDLKSSNILLGDDGRRVVLVDFGIAKLLRPSANEFGLTTVGTRLGSPHAMAPEQIVGEPVDARTDIYALGILCYELLTAQRPFPCRSWEEVETSHLHLAPPPLSQLAAVPPGLEAVVLRCLEKKPHARYPSVGSFLEALRESVKGVAIPVSDGVEQTVAQTGYAIGLLAEVRQLPGDARQLDDRTIDSMFTMQRLLEEAMVGAQMEIALRTSTTLLAVRVLPDDSPVQSRSLRAQTAAFATRLHGILSRSDKLYERLCLAITMHCGAVIVDPQSQLAIAGELLETALWPSPARCGAYGTPAALAGLAHPQISLLE